MADRPRSTVQRQPVPGSSGRRQPDRSQSQSRSWSWSSGSSDQGSGTVLVVGVVAVLLALLAALVPVCRALVAARLAAAGADLTALAAYQASPQTTPGACDPLRLAAAEQSAAANAVLLDQCRVLADGTVLVSVRVQVDLLDRPSWSLGAAVAQARAGPG